MSFSISFQNSTSNNSICNTSYTLAHDEFSYPFFENDYISLEDLEKQINKEALLCFSSISCNINNKTENNNLNSEKTREKNFELSRNERPTDCVVCSRPAKCCHFDVPSCLGCRSFFRRSVLGQRTYVCKNIGNCQIEKGELCRSCRFDRCLLGGMDFRTIQKFPDGVEVDKISAMLTERKHQLSKKDSSHQIDINSGQNNIIMQRNILTGSERHEFELLQILLYSDDNLLHIRHSETDISTIYYDKSIYDILQNIDGGDLMHSILSRFDLFSKKRKVSRTSDFFLHQLREGHDIFSPNWLFIDSFLIIEMTKTLPVLNQLSLKDKIRLYSRNGLATIVFSQLFYSKTFLGSEILIFPTGFSPLMFVHDKLSNQLFYKHMIIMKEFNLSREEFLILRALIFFNTATAELSRIGYGIVQTELEKLSKTLMFYERRKWGDAGGAERFANLMLIIGAAFQIGKTHRKFLMCYKNNIMKENDNNSNELKPFFPKFMKNVITENCED
ncbi:hypothetical protein ACQ4LE_007782 [Meloidogyne hapla]